MPRFCCSRTTHLSPVALFTTDPLSVASIDAASASRSYHRKATGQATATGRERNVSSSSAGPTSMDSSSNARVYLPNVCRSNRSIGFYVSAYAPPRAADTIQDAGRSRRTPNGSTDNSPAIGQRQDGFSYLVDFTCDCWLENPSPPQLDVLRAAAAVVPDSQGCFSRTRRRWQKPNLYRAACVSR